MVLKQFKKIAKKVLKVFGYDLDHERLLKRYRDILPYKFQTILDIGANVGQFSREILDIFPNVEIYAFEPVASCYQKLEKISKKPNFHPLPYALGNQSGEMKINVSSYSPSSSLLKMSNLHKKVFPHTAGEHKEKIQIRRLDDMASELNIKAPLLIKMDVQGYEKEVILGGRMTFAKASAVLTEASFVPLYDGQPLFKEIRSLLGELGFDYHSAMNSKKNPQTGEILFEDSLFIKISSPRD